MTLFHDSELMYDATPGGVDAIPAGAPVVAGYIDGNFQSFPLLQRRFGGRAHIVSIGVNIGNLAEVSDVEDGNAINTPALVRADFEHKKAHGVWKPCYYAPLAASVGMLNTVIPGLSGIPRSEFRLWLADWDGTENEIPLPGGFVEAAKQFRNAGPYDVSVIDRVAFLGPHIVHHHRPAPKPVHHPTPKPPPPPKPVPLPVHKKVMIPISGGAVAAGIVALLGAEGVHLTATAGAGIATAAAAILGIIQKAISGGQ